MEYSYVFRDIEFCIADRRDNNICMTVTINMSKYQTTRDTSITILVYIYCMCVCVGGGGGRGRGEFSKDTSTHYTESIKVKLCIHKTWFALYHIIFVS